MNRYLIVFGEKHYATHADNLMEAEEKLFEHLGNVDQDTYFKISQIDSLDGVEDKFEIKFF